RCASRSRPTRRRRPIRRRIRPRTPTRRRYSLASMDIDLRSDTVTRPTLAMRKAMAEAEVGDDVYDEDPTVHRLQSRVAELLGAGGAPWDPAGLGRVVATAHELGIKAHLDGARLWNAAVACGTTEKELARGFDSISVCLSKGLGAPAGSLVAGSRDLIKRCHR